MRTQIKEETLDFNKIFWNFKIFDRLGNSRHFDSPNFGYLYIIDITQTHLLFSTLVAHSEADEYSHKKEYGIYRNFHVYLVFGNIVYIHP